MIYTCEKYYNGYASVRSFIMEQANKKHEVLEITLDGDKVPFNMRGQKMRINSKTPYRLSPFVQTAKYDGKGIKVGQKYYLWDYKWEPIVEKPTDYTNEGLELKLKAMKEALFGKKDEQLKI